MTAVTLKIHESKLRSGLMTDEMSAWCRTKFGPAHAKVDGKRRYNWQAKWIGWTSSGQQLYASGAPKNDTLHYAYYFKDPSHATLFALKWL